jgi:hypothetical protein
MDKCIEIPMDDCNIVINVGLDGVWLHFSSSKGLSTSLNIDVMGNEKGGGIISRGLLAWCNDMRSKANQIISDNGQFGVGA